MVCTQNSYPDLNKTKLLTSLKSACSILSCTEPLSAAQFVKGGISQVYTHSPRGSRIECKQL